MAKKNANSEQRIKKDPRKRTVDIPGLPQDYAIEPERTLEAIPGANRTFTVDCGHGDVAKFVDGRCIFEGRDGEVCKKKTSFDRKGDWIRHCGKHLAKELQTSLKYRCSFAGCTFTALQKSGVKTHYVAVHLELALHLCDFCGKAYRRPDAKSRHQPKCPKRKDEAQQDDHTGANSTVVRECGETGSSTTATSTSGTVAKGACRNTTKADSPVAPRAATPKRAARKRERSISGPRDVPVKSRKTLADAPRRRDESQGRPVAPPEAPTIARAISPLPTRMPLPRPFPRFFLANTEELHDEIDRQKTRIRELEQALRDVQNGVIGKPADTPTRPAEARHRDSIDTQRRASVAPAAMRKDPLTLRGASFSRLGSSTPTREGSVETLVPRESSVPPRHAFMRERSTFSNASTRLSRRDSLATPPPYTPVEGMSRRASFASLAATDEGSDAGDRMFQEAVANAVATYGEDYLDDFYRRHNDHTDDEGTVHGEGTPFKLPGGSGDFELVEERAYNSAPYDGDVDAEDNEDEDYEDDYDEDHDDCDEEDEEEVDELDSDNGEEDLAEEKTDGPESKDDF